MNAKTMTTHPAIAIDGPAASGKSTVAKRLAAELSYCFINTGAMYRAIAWCTLEAGIDPKDSAAVIAMLPSLPISFGREGSVSCVLFEGRKLAEELSETRVNDAVPIVAAIPEVRHLLVAKQRDYNKEEAVVMEGRDIATVVFPDTPYKYYVTASEEVRAARRRAEGITDSIAERDRQDQERSAAPLRQAPGAVLVDSSDMTIEEVVSFIIQDIRSKS